MTVKQAIAGIVLSNELPTKWKDIDLDEKEQIKKRWAADYEEIIEVEKRKNPKKYKGISKEQEEEKIKNAVKEQERIIKQINDIKSGLTEAKRKIFIK